MTVRQVFDEEGSPQKPVLPPATTAKECHKNIATARQNGATVPDHGRYRKERKVEQEITRRGNAARKRGESHQQL